MRHELIKIAHGLPKGDPARRQILAAIHEGRSKTAKVTWSVEVGGKGPANFSMKTIGWVRINVYSYVDQHTGPIDPFITAVKDVQSEVNSTLKSFESARKSMMSAAGKREGKDYNIRLHEAEIRQGGAVMQGMSGGIIIGGKVVLTGINLQYVPPREKEKYLRSIGSGKLKPLPIPPAYKGVGLSNVADRFRSPKVGIYIEEAKGDSGIITYGIYVAKKQAGAKWTGKGTISITDNGNAKLKIDFDLGGNRTTESRNFKMPPFDNPKAVQQAMFDTLYDLFVELGFTRISAK